VRRLRTSLATAAVVVLAMTLVTWGLSPERVVVDTRVVTHGPLAVHVRDDGVTRIRERYVVSAPLTGRASRVDLHAGDAVAAGATTLCTIEPVDPSLLDPRALAEAEARVDAAREAAERADARLASARIGADHAIADLERAERLAPDRVISQEQLDDAIFARDSSLENVVAAEHDPRIARYEIALMEAALLRTRPGLDDTSPRGDWRMKIDSPVDGRVLRVFHESEGPVSLGAELVEVGDPLDLELVCDLVSEDAVRVRAGQPAEIRAWGGTTPLRARVRVVEPRGFTKVSPLGVEEQRVNVVLDLISPPAERPGLGDDFRIEARIEVDRVEDAVLVPLSALFRTGNTRGVFVVESGRARLVPVSIARRGEWMAEVTEGLVGGEQVIEYPPDTVRDGVAVRPRSLSQR
jgi:HlyD family secretion protein